MVLEKKLWGPVLLAALVIALASPPNANAAQFTAAKYPATISGSQSVGHKITVGGSSITCTTVTVSGTWTAASETQDFIPTYSGCTAFGFIGASITGWGAGGCRWRKTASGTFTLVCAAGVDIHIHAGPCSVTWQAGFIAGLHANTFTNGTPSANRVTLDTNLSGIHSVVKSGFGCPVAGGTYSNATYTGQTVLTGTNEGSEVKIDVG